MPYTLKGYESSVTPAILCIAWAPNQRFVATGGGNKSVNIWDTDPDTLSYGTRFDPAKKLDELWENGHQNTVLSIDWSPDSTKIVSGDIDGVVLRWTSDFDIRTAQSPDRRLRGPATQVRDLLWASDERIAAVTAGGFLYIWDGNVADPITARRLDHIGTCLARSPDRRLMAVGDEAGRISVVDLSHGSIVKTLGVVDFELSTVAWCNEHTIAAAGVRDGSIFLVNTETGDKQEVSGHRKQVYRLSSSACGRVLMSQSADMSMRLWCLDELQARPAEMFEYECGARPNHHIGFTESGDIISMGKKDKVFRTWRVDVEALVDVARGMDQTQLEEYTEMVGVTCDPGTHSMGTISRIVQEACERAGFARERSIVQDPTVKAAVFVGLMPAKEDAATLQESHCLGFTDPAKSIYHFAIDPGGETYQCQFCGCGVIPVDDDDALLRELQAVLESRREVQRELAMLGSVDEEYDLFVSYNTKDRDEVTRYVGCLRRLGLKVWFDNDNLSIGSDIRKKISRAIASSKAACVFVGSEGIGQYQNSEIGFLFQRTPIFPILLSGRVRPPTDDIVFASTKYKTFGVDFDRPEEIAAEIARLLKEQDDNEDKP